MIYYNQKGGRKMSKKNKKARISIELVVKVLIAIGTLLTGIANLIQAIK